MDQDPDKYAQLCRAQSGRHATAPFTLDNANGALPDDMAALKPGTAQTLPFWATGAITLRCLPAGRV